jgi:hypothetical protein
MQGLADVKEVVGIIAGAVLGPEARIALKVISIARRSVTLLNGLLSKVALNAFPDVGPSHIDQATKGILSKVLG